MAKIKRTMSAFVWYPCPINCFDYCSRSDVAVSNSAADHQRTFFAVSTLLPDLFSVDALKMTFAIKKPYINSFLKMWSSFESDAAPDAFQKKIGDESPNPDRSL